MPHFSESLRPSSHVLHPLGRLPRIPVHYDEAVSAVALSVEDGRSINMGDAARVVLSSPLRRPPLGVTSPSHRSAGRVSPMLLAALECGRLTAFSQVCSRWRKGPQSSSAASHACSFSACRAPAQLAHASSLCAAAYPSLKRLQTRC
jgi:hypothetical protein